MQNNKFSDSPWQEGAVTTPLSEAAAKQPQPQPQQWQGVQPNGQPMGNQYGPPPQKKGQGMAVAGMVLGIISIVCCCIPFISPVIAIVSFVLSLLVLLQKKPGEGMAIAGPDGQQPPDGQSPP